MTDKLNLELLGDYLQSSVGGFSGLSKAEKFKDGQSNPIYLLSSTSGQYVLRRQPAGVLLPSAHAVDREYRVMKALQNTEVPVPQTLHLCTDRDVIGSMFYIMSFQLGRVFWNPSLPDLDKQQRILIYDEMNRVLSALHNIDYSAHGLGDFGRAGNYFGRQIARWTRQYEASATEDSEFMNMLIEWLPANLPPDDDRVSLIHGDYRIDNMIFDNRRPVVNALLDWELSTLGHPFADLAYQCMQWRIGSTEIIPGLGGVHREELGIPSELDYVARYCQRRNLTEIANWSFYLIFSFFRFSAILQGVMKRAIEGNASSSKAFEYGALAPRLAKIAVTILEKQHD